MVETEKYGCYHATNEGGYISWYDFCVEFYKQYGLKTTVTITVAELSIASSFDDSVAQTGVLTFPYTPYGAVAKTVHFILDGVEQDTVSTSVSGRQQTYIITGQTHGAHTLRVYFEATINGTLVRSNELYFEIIWVEALNNTPIIASSYDRLTVSQYTTVNIPYTVYTPSSQMSEVVVRVNGDIRSEVTVDRSQQVFSTRLDTAGTQYISIISGTASKLITITVTAEQINAYAETENLALHLSSYGRSNNEADPAVWTFDPDGTGENDIECSFSNFNWTSDGWQLDEDGITALRVLLSNRTMFFMETTGRKAVQVVFQYERRSLPKEDCR